VVAVAVADDSPRSGPLAPLFLEAADHVAVPVHERRRPIGVLDALGQQDRPEAVDGIGQDLGREPHLPERGRDLVGEIRVEVPATPRDLALGADGHPPREILDEPSLVEVAGDPCNRCFARHLGPCVLSRAAGIACAANVAP
ncbi:MAG: hypothetical protein ACK559_22745, partial [bacterium]